MSNGTRSRGDRIRDALWGLFAGDALAMPAHWYYSLANIGRDFDGGVSGFHDPPHPHPEAFMVGMTYRPDVDSAQRLGRPYDILHDHAFFYEASYSPLELKLTERESEHGNPVVAADQRYHYHHGLAAGDNTLAAHLVRVLMRSMIASGGYDQEHFLSSFVDYMTTPGLNRDPYSEIYVRRWFENYSRGTPAYACADYQRRVWSIGSHGGLMRPLVAALSPASDYQALGVAIEHHNLTHRSENNVSALSVLIPLLRSLVAGADPQAAFKRGAAEVRLPRVTGEQLYEQYRSHGGPGGIPRDQMWRLHTELRDEPWDIEAFAGQYNNDEVVRRQFANACYPEHGVPLLLFQAWDNDFDAQAALLANANAGGDNVHRGMVLGLVAGAAGGVSESLIDGLTESGDLRREIDAFADLVAG